MTGNDKFADQGNDEERYVAQPAVHTAAYPNALQRQRAEARLQQNVARSPEAVAALSPAATQNLVHELCVHQIELEMQNEELRESQVALDAVRERYFDLYDLAPVGYCTISEQGLIVQVNLTAASLFGMARGTLLKQPVSSRILKEDQDIYYLHRKRLVEQGDLQTFDLRMVKNDGTQFWAQITMTAGHDAAGRPELRAVLDDITERKQTEAERALLHQALQDKNLELEHAMAVAEKANQAKSDFLSSMSHELRTPLNAILGFGQLLANGPSPLTPEQKESACQILKAGWHLLQLVNDVLDLAVIEAGKLVISLEPVSLAEVMRECEAMVALMAQEHGISLVFPVNGISCFVHVDRVRIKQVLINLLSNAVKYNRSGGTVTVSYQAKSTGRISICIADTGAGLTPDELTQLFQPFNRLRQEENTEEGTGIGLVVCKRLLELMGGAIGVECTIGEGCVFWIELDRAPPPHPLVQTVELTAPPNIEAQGQAGALRTLLYVEDNPANLKLIEAIIARQPCIRLLTAPNGKYGIEMAHQFLPDLILMDIDLPDMSGIKVLQMLIGDPATAHIPVIALSANAMPRDIEKGLKAGFLRYLTKPIKIDEFLKILDIGN